MMTAYVQVKSTPPGSNNNKVKRHKRAAILSPLPENSDEEEVIPKPPSLDDFLPRGHNFFLTEEIQVISDKHGEPVSSEEITLNIGLNGDGDCYVEDDFLEDDFVSDDSYIESTDEEYDTDLEFNEEELLHPTRTNYHDTTGKTKYKKACEDMGIHPVSYIVNNLEQRVLKLRFHGLDKQSLKAISVPLETNTNVEILNLQGNDIDAEGAKCLCRVLRENLFLTEVVLSENKIGTDGAVSLCQFLINNRNLVKVDLTGNDIGDSAGQSFCGVLKGNRTLKELLLCNNSFEENAARWFKEGLSDNESLEIIDLSWNQWKTKGAVCLAEAIEENIGLRRVRMVMAGLGQKGAQAIAEALDNNRTLLELDISFNRIPVEGARSIASGLQSNDVLQVLKIGNNPFGSEGAMSMLEAVEGNESCAIKNLDFTNVMVKIDFKKIQDKLVSERNMTIINDGVLPDTQTDPETFAKHAAFRKNPIHAFRCYAFDAGVNLHNVFNTDNDISLTVKDFKDLLKGAGIDIQDPYFTLLTKALDDNGTLCYWRLLEANYNDEEGVMDSGKPGKPSVTIKFPENESGTDKSKKSGKERNKSGSSIKKKKKTKKK